MIEVLLATLHNLACVFGFGAIGCLAAAAILGLMSVVEYEVYSWDDENQKKIKENKRSRSLRLARNLCVCAFALGIVACIPSVDQLWKVRIALIKYQLASPKNIERGSEEIARIAKKLECKYLGCDEDKKDSP